MAGRDPRPWCAWSLCRRCGRESRLLAGAATVRPTALSACRTNVRIMQAAALALDPQSEAVVAAYLATLAIE